ncbi:MAG: hypothetical protein ABI779_12980 [Acidobacteriota bacterium]
MKDDRVLLCRNNDLFSREAVYQTAEGLDVSSSQAFSLHDRRLLYDDVQLVTLHSDRGLWYLLATGAAAALLLAIAIFIVALDTSMWAVALPFFIFGAAPLVSFLVRLAVGRETVTIHGRRSKAILRFSGLRKHRSREIYGQVCSLVRRAQSAGRLP